MLKCSICGKMFPEATLTKMVQIEDKKAYLYVVCPSCRVIVTNNPNYYPLFEDKND